MMEKFQAFFDELTQSTQMDRSSDESFPGAHLSHLGAPTEDAYFPAIHDEQFVGKGGPELFANRPIGQGRQRPPVAPAPSNQFPGGQ